MLLGVLILHFFLYSEETDLAYRITRSGIQNNEYIWCPDNSLEDKVVASVWKKQGGGWFHEIYFLGKGIDLLF